MFSYRRAFYLILLIDSSIFSINPFQPSVAYHIETKPSFWTAKQMTGFYVKCNTALKWVMLVLHSFSHCKGMFFNFSITSERNLKATNFSNVTLNRTTAKHQPYNKPDNSNLDINIFSKHPPYIGIFQAIHLGRKYI